MSSPCATLAVALLAGAAAVSAQQTLVVDSSNRPGTHFTDLPLAEAAARSGDTLLVRAGTYSPFVTSKALRVLGDGYPRILNYANGQACGIRQLPAGQSATFSGFLLMAAVPVPAVLGVENCQGTVHIEQVVATALGANLVPGIVIDNCSAVTMSSVTASGVPGILVRNSEVAVQNSNARGMMLDLPPPVAFSAMVVDHARLMASNCSFLALSAGPTTIPAPGIWMTSALAAFARGPAASIGASPDGATPTPAIVGTGTVFLDPGMPVRPLGNAPRMLGVVEVPLRMPGQWLQRNTSSINGEVTAAAGSAFVTFLGRPGTPTATPFPDVLWLEAGSLLVFAAGILDSTERAVLASPLPGGLPLGTLLAFQTVAGPIHDLHCSAPAVITTR